MPLLPMLLALAQIASLAGDRDLGAVTDPDGTTRTYVVTYERLDHAPSWAPGGGPPPLSMDRAIELGSAWLLKENPKFEAFRPANITLERVSEGGGKQQWIWVIHYDSRIGTRWFSGEFEAYLLMDGSVVAPKIRKGN